MKKYRKALFIAGMIFALAGRYAGAENTFGINAGQVIPTEDLEDFYDDGVRFEILANLDTPSPLVDVSFGFSYTNLPGRTFHYYYDDHYYAYDYESSDLFSIFLGPKFGKGKGLYFIPDMAVNFDEHDTRFGIDMGIGYLIPMDFKKTCIDISARYSVLNLIGQEDGEDSLEMVILSAGILF
jgi:hypothetical protein